MAVRMRNGRHCENDGAQHRYENTRHAALQKSRGQRRGKGADPACHRLEFESDSDLIDATFHLDILDPLRRIIIFEVLFLGQIERIK